MKDLIEISVNGKVVASNEMYLEGASPLQKIERVKRFSVALADTGVIIESEFALVEEGIAFYEEKKVAPIEPMVVQPLVVEKKEPIVETPTPVQKQMEAVSKPTYNEIPIKTRKPRGPNKPKEEALEKSVFDKSVEETVVPVVPTVEEKKVVAPEVTTPPVKSPAVSTPTTPVRINELAKLIKMWCKAAQYKIEDVTIEVLNAHGASDIIENDSPETVEAGIKEAARLMSA